MEGTTASFGQTKVNRQGGEFTCRQVDQKDHSALILGYSPV